WAVWRTSPRRRELQVELYVTVFAMRRRSPAVRASWLLATPLQLLLPGAPGGGDPRLDAAGAHATAHIESHTAKSCARIHAPDCALCHFLSAPAVTARTVAHRLNVADNRPVPAP